MANNPLSSFYRSIKLYINLPSNFKYYDDSVILNDHDFEVGIQAMTGKDEVILKNPDALLNGKAIESVIKSCVPQVVNPKKLLQVDVDALLVAIRLASYGEKIDIEAECPKCGHKNTFEVNLSENLDQIKPIPEHNEIKIRNGLTIHMKPYTLEDTMIAQRAEFDEYKLIRQMKNESLSDEDRLRFFGQTIEKVSESTSELMARAVDRITLPDGTEVTNREHIFEYLSNSDRKLLKSIENSIKKLSDCGVNKKFSATCINEVDKEKKEICKHTWDVDIDFNPVNFFTES